MSTEPKNETPDLNLPAWLPPAAQFVATKIYQRELNEGTSDDLRLLNRLTSDERMRKVWSVLNGNKYSKSGSSREFSHPMQFYFHYLAQSKRKKASEHRDWEARAKALEREADQLPVPRCEKLAEKKRKAATELRRSGPYFEATAKLLEGEADQIDQPRIGAANSWTEQDCSIYCFFYSAYNIAWDPQPLLYREDLKQINNEYSGVERQLRELAEKLRSLGMDWDAKELERIALEVTDRWFSIEVDYEDSGIEIIDRHRSDVLLRSYVARLAMITRIIFANSLFGTIATTASVALNLERDVTHSQVREMLRSFRYSGMGGYNAIPWD
jgi:hypothetical protein